MNSLMRETNSEDLACAQRRLRPRQDDGDSYRAAFSACGLLGWCGAQRLTSCEASQQDAWFVSIGRSLVLAKPAGCELQLIVRFAECWFRAAPAARTGRRRHAAHARRPTIARHGPR